MARPRRVLILDGYTDEPAGFGVPPYIDVYPRYIAGAFWHIDKSIEIHYLTVDQARVGVREFVKKANTYDTVVVIAGAVVPGKYLGGEPIKLEELKQWFRLVDKPFKILVGAAARWGLGNEGGTVASLPKSVKENFDVIVTGDPEVYILDYARYGPEHAEPWRIVDDMNIVSEVAVKGARITRQHPNHGYNLIAEIETFRSCSRWISGGCSFCVTKLYGRPKQRSPRDIVREVEALYRAGIRHFRIGRQADILVYGSASLGQEEWPRPNPRALEQLFYGIRYVAPGLKTLHIDNMNAGTIVRYLDKSIEALKVIIKYHTPGDVAALGIETADPRVVKANNLKTLPEESLKAIEVINHYGNRPGYNGLPELLPGINFVLGLPGETAETYRLNEEFIKTIYERGLLLRRINVRKVLVLPGTTMARVGTKIIQKHRNLAKRFQRIVNEYSRRFLERLLPRGSMLSYVYVEHYDARLGVTFARQAGSYPIVVEMPCQVDAPAVIRVAIYGYSGRSVRGLPVPLNANTARVTTIAKLLGRSRAAVIASRRPFRSVEELYSVLKPEEYRYFSLSGFTC